MILFSLIFEYIFVGSLNILIKKSKWLWILNAMVNFIVLLMIKNSLPLNYYPGTWSPPFGIEINVSNGSFVFLSLFSIIYPLVNVYATWYEKNDKYFYGFINFLSASLISLAISNDLFNIFVSFELFSLIVFILIGLKKDGKSSIAAIRYIMVNMVAMNFYLLGLIIIYSQTGVLGLDSIAKKMEHSKFVYIGFSFIISALLTKSGLILYSMWLPLSYSSSKTSVAAFLSAMEVPIFVIYRFYTIFPMIFKQISGFMIVIGVSSMIIGSIMATFSKESKYTLSYSMISQSGIMFTGMGLGNIAVIPLYIFFQGISKSLMFVSNGIIEKSSDSLNNNVKKSFITYLIITISSLSLAGLPGLKLFHIKELVFKNSCLLLLSSFLTSIYISRFINKINLKSVPRLTELMIFAPVLLLFDNNKIDSDSLAEILVIVIGIIVGKMLKNKEIKVKEDFFSLESNLIYLTYLITILTIIIVR